LNFKLSKISTTHLWWAGLIWYVATAFSNLGIIATDDYEFGIARIIPAQNWNFSSIIAASGIRSPFPNLFLFIFTKFALLLGITDPAIQLHVALAFAGVINYAIFTYVGFLWMGPLFIFLIAFYFICPMIYTRPLIESLSAPYVFVSAYFAYRYERLSSYRDLIFSIFALMLAAMFRYQTGVCALALLLLVLYKKDVRGLTTLAITGIVAYFISGSLDLLFKGSLHASLFSYTRYQAAEISNFGKQPFYVFFGLFLLLSFPPVLFHRYPGFSWKKTYRPLLAPLLYFLTFLISHSLITHKEERFMVPILPVFFVLAIPLIRYTFLDFPSQWRLKYFIGINFLLLPFASFNVPQNNLIGTARFIHRNENIRQVKEVEGALFNFPMAFIGHPVTKDGLPREGLMAKTPVACDTVFAIREDIREAIPGLDQRYKQVGKFEPGVLERIVIRLNPRQNSRRRAIEVYQDLSCGT
jgi:hypothetical protein